MRRTRIALTTVTIAIIGALGMTACAPEDTPKAAETGSTSCTAADLATLTKGTLTVGTDSPAYDPWFSDNDPSNGNGYESAVAYAVAEELGYDKSDVKWVVTSFAQAIAPGEKKFDVDINQISISDERKNTIDMSTGYFDVTQAVITYEGSPIADAKTVAELKEAKLGAMVGSTSLTDATKIIAPTQDIAVYNDNDQAKAALTTHQIDGIVVDLPTAFYITGAEMEDGLVVGQLPSSGSGQEQFGFVLDLGSPLTPCISKAVDSLRAEGKLAELEDKYLAQAGAPLLK